MANRSEVKYEQDLFIWNLIKRAESPGSQYADTAAGGHEIHILSLIQNSSHSEEGKGWVG